MTYTIPLRAALLCGAALLPAAATAQDAIPLDPIVVQSKRAVATDTAAATTTIDQTEIDDRQAGTIGELIDSVPGVTLVNGSTPAGSGINIRGFGATGSYGTDQMVLIQIDGATTGSEELYRIGTQLYTDPSLYKQVTVNRGTIGSFEYGSGVVGGMLRLETKDASDFTGGVPGWAGRQTLQYSTNGNGRISSTILAWQPTQDLELLGQFVWQDQKEQQDGDGNDTGASPFGNPSWLLKGKYTFGDNAITLSYNDTQSSDRDVPYDQFGLVGGAFGNVDRDIEQKTTILKWEWNPDSPLWNVEANLSRSVSHIDSTYIPGSGTFGDSVAYLGDADHDYETTKLTVKNTAMFDTGLWAHDLRTGFEVIRKERAEPANASAARSEPGGTDRRFALFAVDDARLGGWTLSPALRYETQDLDYEGTTTVPAESYENDALMGGLSARYEWANGLSVFGSGAYTENLPIIDDFASATLMTQPQKARTWELGFGYAAADLAQAGDALQLKANLYRTDLWDATSYTGIDEVRTKGIELEAAYSMANGLYADVNANISEGDSWTAAGVRDYWDYAPADRIRATLGQRLDNGLDLSWEAVASARFDRVESADDEVAGSVIHNIRATYVPQTGVMKGTEFRVGVENLFDTDYRPRLATRDAPGRNIKLTVAKAF